MTNKELLELKREVKAQIQHNLNTIDIEAYSSDRIYYAIYRDIKNDLRTGRKAIEHNFITRNKIILDK